MMGGNGWVVAVNLVIWTGLFLYLLRIERRVRELELTSTTDAATPSGAGLAEMQSREMETQR